jgi:hypothetical protein
MLGDDLTHVEAESKSDPPYYMMVPAHVSASLSTMPGPLRPKPLALHSPRRGAPGWLNSWVSKCGRDPVERAKRAPQQVPCLGQRSRGRISTPTRCPRPWHVRLRSPGSLQSMGHAALTSP